MLRLRIATDVLLGPPCTIRRLLATFPSDEGDECAKRYPIFSRLERKFVDNITEVHGVVWGLWGVQGRPWSRWMPLRPIRSRLPQNPLAPLNPVTLRT